MATARPPKLLSRFVRTIGASALLAALLVAVPGAGAQEITTPGTPELFNLEHVFNFNPENHDPGRHPFVGSDVEFLTHTVPLRDYSTGIFIDDNGAPLPSGAEPLMRERDFAVMGSYQRGGYVFDITDPENPEFVRQVTCRQPRNDVAIKKFTDPATGETRVVLALTQQSGNPCGIDESQVAVQVGVEVNSPASLAGFIPANQYIGTPEVNDETSDLVFAGSGCSPADYLDVDVEGKIALVHQTGDQVTSVGGQAVFECQASTFFQKMQSAEQAGAIGLIQVRADDTVAARTAITSGIPGLELTRSRGQAILDAVRSGTAVNATLTSKPTDEVEFPLIGSGSGGIGVFDITDPFDWKPMYALRTGFGGVHNFAFHPTADVGYAWNGALPGVVSTIPIVDFSDLDNPGVTTGPDTVGGPHDGELNADGSRAYVASENNYEIYDSTDPRDLRLIGAAPNVGSYAHGAFPSPDGQLMITNNESLVLGGFFVNGTGVCPGEGLASYDISNEGTPVGPLGYYVPNVTGQSPRPCTSHFGRFAPGTRVMSIGWYIAGARVVDWSDPSNPVELAGAVMPGMNTWAAKFFKGPYLYTGDIGRGFDVFRWSGEGQAPWVVEPDLPDLTVTDISTASKVFDGRTAEITATVANLGSGDAGASTTEFVLDGETVIGTAETASIPAGGTAEVSVPWRTSGVKGEHTIRATADVAGAVEESDETNNAGVLTVQVKGNKVTNGSFEQEGSGGGSPEGWTANDTAAGETEWSTDGEEGSRGAVMQGTGGSALLHGTPTWTSAPVAVSAGEVLDLLVSVKATGTSSAPQVALEYLGAAGGVLDTVTALTAPLATQGFATLEKTITIPDGVAEVRVVLRGFALTDTATSGRVVFDNVGLYAA